MLISHRRSAYIDNEELERAAGAFEIEAKQANPEHIYYFFLGAACVLRLLQDGDYRDYNDLLKSFKTVSDGVWPAD